MKRLSAIDWIALILVVVGALNWGLVGLFKFDLVALLSGGMAFGETNIFSRLVYVLVGLSALYVAAIAANLAKKD